MDLDFLSNYQKCLFTDEAETSSQRAGVQRKCTAQMYSYASGTLDEKTTAHLLECSLNTYYDTLDEDSTRNNILKKKLQEAKISGPVDLKSDLKNADFESFLPRRLCHEEGAGFACTRSQKAIDDDFQEFSKALRKPKGRKLEKRVEIKGLQCRSGSDEGAKVRLFKTGREELAIQTGRKVGGPRRTLGLSRRTGTSKFVPPLLCNQQSTSEESQKSSEWPLDQDERLKNIDPKMIELIKSEIMDVGSKIEWSDIAGLEFAKNAIQEAVVWPMLRPDIFKGLRRPPKGILLFGPPGTGKTLIGKCVASQSKSTFFSISASSLTSKWVGEGEKMVRALFTVARCHQPSVIFIDEIDSLLSQRSESEHESSRRIKTEFLVQLDGATTDGEERILLIGATNRPQELDEAARRRFVKRLYIPLPEFSARLQLVTSLMSTERHELCEDDFQNVAQLSEGYSGADIRNLCSEASLGPIRAIHFTMIEKIQADQVRALKMEDFHKAFSRVKSSVSGRDLELYVEWDKTYGAGL